MMEAGRSKQELDSRGLGDARQESSQFSRDAIPSEFHLYGHVLFGAISSGWFSASSGDCGHYWAQQKASKGPHAAALLLQEVAAFWSLV